MSRDWRARTACRDRDPELFFPSAASGLSFETQVATAKAICGGCPVREACLADALERMPYGIAGGLTEDERRTVRRLVTGGDIPRPAKRQAHEGRRLLTSGLSTRTVARRCEVSERTAQRWAAVIRAGEGVAS